jgi:hypothetical protein
LAVVFTGLPHRRSQIQRKEEGKKRKKEGKEREIRPGRGVQNGKCGGGCRTGNKELHGIGLFK